MHTFRNAAILIFQMELQCPDMCSAFSVNRRRVRLVEIKRNDNNIRFVYKLNILNTSKFNIDLLYRSRVASILLRRTDSVHILMLVFGTRLGNVAIQMRAAVYIRTGRLQFLQGEIQFPKEPVELL